MCFHFIQFTFYRLVLKHMVATNRRRSIILLMESLTSGKNTRRRHQGLYFVAPWQYRSAFNLFWRIGSQPFESINFRTGPIVCQCSSCFGRCTWGTDVSDNHLMVIGRRRRNAFRCVEWLPHNGSTLMAIQRCIVTRSRWFPFQVGEVRVARCGCRGCRGWFRCGCIGDTGGGGRYCRRCIFLELCLIFGWCCETRHVGALHPPGVIYRCFEARHLDAIE